MENNSTISTECLPLQRIPVGKRLSIKQARHTLLLTMALGTILATSQIVLESLSLGHRTDTIANQVLAVVRDPAAEAAEAHDRFLAIRVLNGLAEYRAVLSAEIRDEKATVLERFPIRLHSRSSGRDGGIRLGQRDR